MLGNITHLGTYTRENSWAMPIPLLVLIKSLLPIKKTTHPYMPSAHCLRIKVKKLQHMGIKLLSVSSVVLFLYMQLPGCSMQYRFCSLATVFIILTISILMFSCQLCRLEV